MNQYLIAANSKKGQLIFNIFRPIDLAIALTGAGITLLLFFIVNPSSLVATILVLLPLAVCSFLVIPIANYHNVMCALSNIYKYYFSEQQDFKWKGWCAKDEFKD